MKSGIIGVCAGNFGSINSFNDTRQDKGYTLHTCVEVGPVQQSSLSTGGQINLQRGRALIEDTEKISIPSVQNRQIVTNDQWEKVASMTEFLVAPGDYVLVDDTEGLFVFDIMESQTSNSFSRPTIDLDAYAQTRPNADPWKYGFNNAGTQAEKGTVYGTDVVSDPDMGAVLSRSDKNQLGLQLSYNGRQTKVEASENGFVRIIEPSVGNRYIANFIHDELQPHW